MSKKGLGRGLSALIPPTPLNIPEEDSDILWIKLNDIEPNKNQPRRNIEKEKLTELANSIEEHGVVQPIIVTKNNKGTYQIIAGERRWRACKMANIETIPAIIRDYSPQQASEIALIENIQREDLNPIEEALAFKTLIEDYKLKQEELSKKIGKSRPYIANTLRLLNLNDEVRSLLSEGQITTGHARTLLSLEDEEIQKEIAYKIIDERLSVRQTEEIVNSLNNKNNIIEVNKAKTQDRDPILNEIEDKLQTYFGTKVILKYNKGKGKIEINYYSNEELDRLLEVLTEKENIDY